jgi:hypothetical protein
MFRDHLEAIVLGDADADKTLMNDAADRLSMSSLLACAEIDPNERQVSSPERLSRDFRRPGPRAKRAVIS